MNNLQRLRKEIKTNKILAQQQINNNQQLPQKQTKKLGKEWGLFTHQRNIEPKQEIIHNKSLQEAEFNVLKYNKNWQYTHKHKFVARVMPNNIYYPPTCSGYDMTYCKFNETLYIYGGISCSSSLSEGIKHYFYKYKEGKWNEIKPESVYNPSPRYGHTITAYQKDLILFGGVSQYKQKLKDRCFYADFSAYSTSKNCWKVIQSSGHYVKTRKNHAASIYNKFYIIYGGLNESEQTINEINWINMDCKKSCWKSFKMEGRFNHKMVVIEPESGRDFLCIFGGRNSNSEITNSLFYVPLTIYNGQLQLKDAISINHIIQARQFPIMTHFHQGFLILGGINQNSDMVEDCWHYNGDRQTIQEIKMDLQIKDLRGAKGYALGGCIYILAGSNLHYKALQVEIQK